MLTAEPGAPERSPSLLSRVVSRLTRATSSGAFIPEIDGLRCLSIGLVILYHTPYHVSPEAPAALSAVGMHGNFGVQMFFAISGFILGLPFAVEHISRGRKVDLRRYFVRRLTRLEPPYLINLAFWFAIKVLFLRRSALWLLPHLLASVTYTHNLIYGQPSEVNFYAWSLEVEVQFYVVAPLLGLVFTRSRALRLSLLAMAIVGTSLVTPGLSLATEVPWFLVGFVLADLYLVPWHEQPVTGHAWDALGLLAWPLLFVVQSVPQASPATHAICRLALPWILLAAYATALRGPLIRSVLRWKPIYVVGGMCYTIYLYHGYVLEAVVALQRRYLMTGHYCIDTVAGLIGIAVAVIGVSSVLFVAFEKPFMNRRWPGELWSYLTEGTRPARSAETSKP
jgi:peptidoglycan/LPS O-acetylase OafA/YrhL